MLIFALLIRLLCLYLFKNIDNYDLESFKIVGNLTKNLINIYPSPADVRYPYLPLYLYFEALFSPILLKTISVIFDLGILYLIVLLSKKNKNVAFLYAANPVTILIVTLHGQFDVLPLFFLMLTIYLIKKRKELMAILYFSLAILLKTWPLIFALVIFKEIRDKRLILLTALFPLVGIFLYSYFFDTNPLAIISTAASYQGLQGIWGFGYIFQSKLFLFIFLTVLFIYSFLVKGKDLIQKSYTFLLFFFFTTLGFSVQYLSWIIPLLILQRKLNAWWLLIPMTTYILSLYSFWVFYPHTTVVPSWLSLFQNFLGVIIWLSFGYCWYISTKISYQNNIKH